MKLNTAPVKAYLARKHWTATRLAMECGLDPQQLRLSLRTGGIRLSNASSLAYGMGLRLSDILVIPDTKPSGHTPLKSSVEVDREKLLEKIADGYGEIQTFAEQIGISYCIVYKTLWYGYCGRAVYEIMSGAIGKFAKEDNQ